MPVQLDMIGITASDMAASLRFYRLLGLAIPEGVEGEAHVAVAAEQLRLSSANSFCREVWSSSCGHVKGAKTNRISAA